MTNKLQILLVLVLMFSINACQKRKPKIPTAVALERFDSSNLSKADSKLTLDSIFNNLSSGGSDSLNRKFYFDIADRYRNLDELDAYLSTINHIKKLAGKNFDSVSLARAYSYTGDFYENTTKPDSAFANYVTAGKICRAIKDSVNMGRTNLYKAGVLFDLGIFTEAEAQAVSALRMLEKSGKTNLIYETHLLIGLSLNETHDYENALKYFDLALADLEKALDEGAPLGKIALSKAGCFNNMGAVYERQKMYPKAIEIFNKAIETPLLKKQRPEIYAMLLEHLAFCKMKLGIDKGVFETYMEAFKIRDSINAKPGIITNSLALGEYYVTKKDTPNGLKYLKKGYDLAIKSNSNFDIVKSLKLLSENDRENKNYYTNLYFKVDDSLRNLDMQTRNKFGRIAYESERLEKENKDLVVRHKSTFWILSILAIVFLGFAISFKLKAKHKEVQHAREQKEANETIYNLIMGQQDMKENILNEERSRMGRELHDGVVNGIFTTRFGLLELQSNDEKQKKKLIDELQKTEIEIRRVSHDLSKDFLFEDASVPNIIKGLVDSQQKISQTVFTLNIDRYIDWTLVSGDGKVHVYRILQECIQNIHKYAKAKHCNIIISKTSKEIELKIWDDGIGFDFKKASQGIGLKNIQERVRFLKGKINIDTKKGEGTKIDVSFDMLKKEIEDGQFMQIKGLSDEDYDKEWDREFSEM